MRRIVLVSAVSLDGYIEGTYEVMTAFWPTADSDPEATEATVEFALLWRDIPKIVYSRTLEDLADLAAA